MSPRHHTVPQFYLRHFADGDGKLLLVDRDDPTRTLTLSVRKAISEVGFYRLDPNAFVVDPEGDRPDPEIVEHHLSRFEVAAAPGVYKLAQGSLLSLTRDDWFHLINLMALQTVRGNRFREDMQAVGNHEMRLYLGETISDGRIRSWLEEQGDTTTPEDVAEFRENLLGPDGPKLVPTQEFLIQQGFKLALEALNERLADDMAWSLITADQTSVLTSDEPVCWWSPGDDPVGFGNAEVVWFPVGRRHILQLRQNESTISSLGLPDASTPEGAAELVRLVNGEVAAQAHRWIVHHPDDQPLDGVEVQPRTAWGDELVSVEEQGSTRRELWIHRRLPVPGQP